MRRPRSRRRPRGAGARHRRPRRAARRSPPRPPRRPGRPPPPRPRRPRRRSRGGLWRGGRPGPRPSQSDAGSGVAPTRCPSACRAFLARAAHSRPFSVTFRSGPRNAVGSRAPVDKPRPASPRMRPSLLAALSLALLVAPLAGCFDGDDDGAGGRGGRAAPLEFRDDWAERAVPYSDHDHHAPEEHQGLSTPNFEELGWDPLISEYYGRSAGGYLCGDSVDNGDRRLAAVHGISTDIAFELVDVTDATKPTVLGEFIMPRGASRDVALTPDGNFVA